MPSSRCYKAIIRSNRLLCRIDCESRLSKAAVIIIGPIRNDIDPETHLFSTTGGGVWRKRKQETATKLRNKQTHLTSHGNWVDVGYPGYLLGK